MYKTGGHRSACWAAKSRSCLKTFSFEKFWNTLPADSETIAGWRGGPSLPHASLPTLTFCFGLCILVIPCHLSVLWILPIPALTGWFPQILRSSSQVPFPGEPQQALRLICCLPSYREICCALTPLPWAGLLPALYPGLCCSLLYQPLSQPWHGGGFLNVDWVLSAWSRANFLQALDWEKPRLRGCLLILTYQNFHE